MLNRSNVVAQLRRWSVTVLAVLLGLQLIRVFVATLVYYLWDALGFSAVAVGLTALGVFALGFLAGPLHRYVGPRGALLTTAMGVAGFRVAEQLSFSPALNLFLSGAGVVCFLMYLPTAAATMQPQKTGDRQQFALALLLGVAADTALHTLARTLDLSWRPGLAPALIVIALALLLLLAVRWNLSSASDSKSWDAKWASTLPLLAVGPWLFLQLVVFQNVARAGALTGWSLPAAGGLLIAGNVLGLLAAAQVIRIARGTLIVAGAGGSLLVLAQFFTAPAGDAAALLLLAGQTLAALLITMVFSGPDQGAARPGVGRTTVGFGFGHVLFVLLVFMYYASYDIALGIRSAAVLPVAAALLAVAACGAAARKHAAHAPRSGQVGAGFARPNYAPAAASLLFLLVPLVLAATWRTPQTVSPPPDNASVRVISYNVHAGFDIHGRLDIEALAAIIEQSGAEVVALQEVSRGWLINGSLDMLEWLSERLQMPYVSGPTADPQWGNAILSRYPIVSATNVPLPPDGLLLWRGRLLAEIDVGQTTLRVINTHLHHVEGDSNIRQEQVRQLLSAWDGMPRTVLVGDLNARPNEPEIALLAQAGLLDVAAASGPHYTYPSDNPSYQIDYIWVSPDLDYSDFEIPHTTASDHLPLVVTLTLP